MNITTVNHQFRRPPTKRSRTDLIVIHHSAGNDAPAATVHTWHLDRDWIGIGYHFVIRASGAIETGRQIDTVGAHAGAGANGRSIGICVMGNLDQRPPTPAQINSLVWLIKEHIYKKYGELQITGHKEHMATACPGRHFPMEEVKRQVKDEGVTLIINGKKINTELKIEAGRTFVLLDGEKGKQWIQIRALADLLGAQLNWNATTKTATMIVR